MWTSYIVSALPIMYIISETLKRASIKHRHALTIQYFFVVVGYDGKSHYPSFISSGITVLILLVFIQTSLDKQCRPL